MRRLHADGSWNLRPSLLTSILRPAVLRTSVMMSEEAPQKAEFQVHWQRVCTQTPIVSSYTRFKNKQTNQPKYPCTPIYFRCIRGFRKPTYMVFHIQFSQLLDIFMLLRAIMDANYRMIAFVFTVIGEKMIKYFVYIWSKNKWMCFVFFPLVIEDCLEQNSDAIWFRGLSHTVDGPLS